MSGVPHVIIVIKTTVSEPGINLSQAKTSLFNELHSQGKKRGKTWLINHKPGIIMMQVRYLQRFLLLLSKHCCNSKMLMMIGMDLLFQLVHLSSYIIYEFYN